MRPLLKIVLSIVIILAMTLSIGLMLINWSAVGTPPPLDFLGSHVTRLYLFWGGLTLTVLWLALLIVIVAWPKTFQLYQLNHTNGQLRITKRAINNFTLAALRDEPFICDPKVTTKLSKRRLKVKINGSLRSAPNTAQQSRQFALRLERDLKQLLGVDQTRKVDVRLTDFKRDRRSKTPRVV